MKADLAGFARECGVEVTDCDPSWGGRFGYKTVDEPDLEICGFRSERAALLRWLDDTLGDSVGRVVRKRLGL